MSMITSPYNMLLSFYNNASYFFQPNSSNTSAEEQLDIAEQLYGDTIQFQYGEHEIRELLGQDQVYAEDVKKRVYTVLMQQRRKYQYLFK